MAGQETRTRRRLAALRSVHALCLMSASSVYTMIACFGRRTRLHRSPSLSFLPYCLFSIFLPHPPPPTISHHTNPYFLNLLVYPHGRIRTLPAPCNRLVSSHLSESAFLDIDSFPVLKIYDLYVLVRLE